MSRSRRNVALLMVLAVVAAGPVEAKKNKKKRSRADEDPYASYVWPPPPDPARIRLVEVLTGRADVEAGSRFQKLLIGASPQTPFDHLVKPFGLAYDTEGRLLVSDPALAAVLRFDRQEGRLDVIGVRGSLRLKTPLGLAAGPAGGVLVADVGLRRVVAFDADGAVTAAYGATGELSNPTDAVRSPDGAKIFVADSKTHEIVVFEAETARLSTRFGRRGEGPGELAFPTSLAFGPEGELYVVDQLNARVQIFSESGEFLDQIGAMGVAYGNFVRPKDVAVDEMGLIYVTDNAFNNLQLFDADLGLLTFIGEAGIQPGQFHGASGVAVHGDEFAVVDQLGHRVQIFRFLTPKDR